MTLLYTKISDICYSLISDLTKRKRKITIRNK